MGSPITGKHQLNQLRGQTADYTSQHVFFATENIVSTKKKHCKLNLLIITIFSKLWLDYSSQKNSYNRKYAKGDCALDILKQLVVYWNIQHEVAFRRHVISVEKLIKITY
jgi:hypothetical protein